MEEIERTYFFETNVFAFMKDPMCKAYAHIKGKSNFFHKLIRNTSHVLKISHSKINIIDRMGEGFKSILTMVDGRVVV